MRIIPAIYLSGGNAVSNYKGESEQSTLFTRDPLVAARKFEKQGAKLIHLVDSDPVSGAKEKNWKVVQAIAKNTSLEVIYSDGISTLEDIEALFAAGIDYVSLNQFSHGILKQALEKFGPEKIFFTIRTLKHVIEGMPGVDVIDFGGQLVKEGVKNIILRDMKAEGSLHPNYDEVEHLLVFTKANVFAFGGVGSMEDLEIFQRTGVSGVMISRAFFEMKISLQDCIAKFEG